MYSIDNATFLEITTTKLMRKLKPATYLSIWPPYNAIVATYLLQDTCTDSYKAAFATVRWKLYNYV